MNLFLNSRFENNQGQWEDGPDIEPFPILMKVYLWRNDTALQ